VITLLEPPRPAGLISGGFRYQEQITAALGADARRETVRPEHLHEHARTLREAAPSLTVVADGWFAELTARPFPAGVIPLLHTQPTLVGWAADVRRAIATGASTAAAARASVDDVALVRPGVDDCFTPRARAGDDTPAVICAGTIAEAKGQRRLLAALRGAPPPWRLTLVGSTRAAPQAVEALRREALGAPVTIREAVEPAALAELYAEHDLFATLSTSESYGMAAAEAAAAGLPLLGLDTGELHSFGDEESRTILPIDATDDVVTSALRRLLARPHALRSKRATRPGQRRTWRCAATEFAAACR
jgi:glycosyltransferase involved in cell wall biosynthesis